MRTLQDITECEINKFLTTSALLV